VQSENVRCWMCMLSKIAVNRMLCAQVGKERHKGVKKKEKGTKPIKKGRQSAQITSPVVACKCGMGKRETEEEKVVRCEEHVFQRKEGRKGKKVWKDISI
jgi:hypothetical protein